MIETHAMAARPTLGQRFWGKLGFGMNRPEPFEAAPETLGLGQWEHRIVTDLDWRDRLRLLVSGRCAVVLLVAGHPAPNAFLTTSAWGVLIPGDRGHD